MNVLFCHDGPINCDEKNRYYSIGFNDDLMSRYSAVFENVGIVTRVNRNNLKTAYNEADKLSDDKHMVVEYPNYLTLKGIFANNQILFLCQNCRAPQHQHRRKMLFVSLTHYS